VSETYSVEWTVHLARRDPRKTAAALLAAAGGALIAGFGFRSAAAGILTLVLLLGSLRDYLLPVRYRLGPEGIEARGLLFRRVMQWSQVRRILRDPAGVKLSPLPRHSRREAYRGIYLWFERNEAEVMATIAHYREVAQAGGDDGDDRESV
jgi:hypothetical protein